MVEDFWEQFVEKSVRMGMTVGTKLIYAAIVIVIGLIIIRLVMNILRRVMNKAGTELSLRSFLESLSIAILYSILVFSVGISLGIKASAFLTLIGAAGIAIGLALQGSLSNFAGGLLILMFKPFKIGDEVIIQGVQGEVIDINILYTRLSDWRGQHYTLPNGNVSNDIVKNNTAEEFRRVQIELHLPLEVDFDKVREIVTSTMKKNPDASQDKPFQLWISNFQDYYIMTSARCWCKSSEYWGVYWAQEEAIKKALEENGIKLQIPKQIIERENAN